MANKRAAPPGPVNDSKIPPLLSVVEAADLLGTHRNGVLWLINRGKLPARKVGSTWVIREAALTALTEDDKTE